MAERVMACEVGAIAAAGYLREGLPEEPLHGALAPADLPWTLKMAV